MPQTIRILDVKYPDPIWARAVTLRQAVLRTPLNLAFTKTELEDETSQILLAVMSHDELIGCAMMKWENAQQYKLRQMAVAEEARGQGVGSCLLAHAETLARQHAASTLVLHARLDAAGFYEKRGYRQDGETFTEVTIPHVRMRKDLARRGDVP